MAKTEFKLLTEKELRAIKPEELENIDVDYYYRTNHGIIPNYVGRAIFDYDQGLSLLRKGDTSFCLVGFHGPAYKGDSHYEGKADYEEKVSAAIYLIKTGEYRVAERLELCNVDIDLAGGSPTCSFT